MNATYPQSIEQFRTVAATLITETLDMMKADYTVDQVQQLTDEIIFSGCPNIFGVSASELSFAADVQRAGNCLELAGERTR